MAWCPICKAEFDENNTCPECKVELLPESESYFTDIFSFSNEEITLNVFNFLIEQDYEMVQYYYDETTCVYHILIPNEFKEEISEKIIYYLSANNPVNDISKSEKNELENIVSELINEKKLKRENSKSYVSAETKYEDVNSSAVSLLFVGVLGLIILFLDITNVYHFPFSGASRILFLVTMGVLFVVFFISGIMSIKKAKKLALEIQSEDNLQDEISSFISKELDLSAAEELFDADSTPEIKCLARTEYIATKVIEAYPDADPAFIDYIIENLYDSLYE